MESISWTGRDPEATQNDLSVARAKAERWKRFKDTEDLDATFDAMEQALFRGIAGSKPSQAASREKAYDRICALRDMRKSFDIVIGGGKAAARELQRIEGGKRPFF